MNDIFISYSNSDKTRVTPLAQLLESKGWSVWWDRKIQPGETFDRVIEKALDAAKCVLVVWSIKSVESDWVRTEAYEGKSRDIIVPILIDDVKIPLAFRLVEAADLIQFPESYEQSELDLLLETIESKLGKVQNIRNPFEKLEKELNLKKIKKKKFCALVIGHKPSSPGAVNRKYDLTEFDFNEYLALLIEKKVRGVKIKRVFRTTYRELPDELNALNPDFVISLHCNTFNRRTSGSQVLYYSFSEKGGVMANSRICRLASNAATLTAEPPTCKAVLAEVIGE